MSSKFIGIVNIIENIIFFFKTFHFPSFKLHFNLLQTNIYNERLNLMIWIGEIMFRPANKLVVLSCAFGVAAWILTNCSSAPEVEVEPEPKEEIETVIEAPPDISMEPYHYSMSEEMQRSFERANEIIVGVFTDSLKDDEAGLTYYFENFTRFDSSTMTWGPIQKVLLPVLPGLVELEIITRDEFKNLSEYDKVGICWDSYEGKRSIYLVKGIPSLVFLEQVIDAENNISYREMLDVFPVTKDCRAKAVFELMVRDRITH